MEPKCDICGWPLNDKHDCIARLYTQLAELKEAAQDVVRRHDNGTLSGAKDSVSVNRLRTLSKDN